MSEKKWYNQSTSRFYCDLGSSFESAQADIIVSNAYTSARFYAYSQEDMTIASTGRYIYIKDSRYATADELRASFTNEYIFVSLATPEEYPIVTKTAPNYIGSDYGVEEFTGSKVPLNANILFYMRSLVGETRNFLDRLYDNTDKTDAKEVADYITNGIEGNKELATNAPNLALRALFVAAGAEYNDTDQIIQKTAPWEKEEKWRLEDDGTYTYWEEPAIVEHLPKHYYLNGLGDITEEQMMVIYNAGVANGASMSSHYEGYNKLRTCLQRNPYYNYPRPIGGYDGINMNQSFQLCSVIEIINVTRTIIYVKTAIGAFQNCGKLVRIYDILNLSSVSKSGLTSIFASCSSLESVRIRAIKVDISFSDSPNLNKESVVYLIDNASPTSAITITLHADAYARLKDDADIVAALAAQPLITLVSA